MIEPIAVFRISKWLWMIPAWNNVMNDDSALNIIADLQTSWLSRLKKKTFNGIRRFYLGCRFIPQKLCNSSCDFSFTTFIDEWASKVNLQAHAHYSHIQLECATNREKNHKHSNHEDVMRSNVIMWYCVLTNLLPSLHTLTFFVSIALIGNFNRIVDVQAEFVLINFRFSLKKT